MIHYRRPAAHEQLPTSCAGAQTYFFSGFTFVSQLFHHVHVTGIPYGQKCARARRHAAPARPDRCGSRPWRMFGASACTSAACAHPEHQGKHRLCYTAFQHTHTYSTQRLCSCACMHARMHPSCSLAYAPLHAFMPAWP
jgi:hypothetical protein